MAAKTKVKKKTRKKKRRGQHWPWLTLGLYSDSGVGKTTVAATAPKPIILDSNMGLMSIKGREGFGHVVSEPVTSIKHLSKYYDRLSGTGRPSWAGRFETTVFDHFDDIQAIVLDELTQAASKKDDRRIEDDPAQREYGIMGNRLKRFIRQFKSLPMHKILIFSTGMDRETGKLQPNLIGQLRNQMPYFCDMIFYMRIAKGGKRMLYLDGTDRYLAKCRAWWLPERKIVVPYDDPKFFTNLFAQIVAGPKGISNGAKTKE